MTTRMTEKTLIDLEEICQNKKEIQNSMSNLILIVDDTPTNLEVVSETLNDAGFDIAIATSGERALQQVERRQPDLILLDIMMPGIDGFETCKRLKANPKTCDIPIIFMTALADTDSKVQALELGAVDYITKPFHEKEVLARVRTHLQLYRLTQNLESQVAQKTAALQTSQLQLIQSEKMSALGNLVAGIAHEINNPVGFVAGNIEYVVEYTEKLFNIIDLFQRKFPNPDQDLEEIIEANELDYIYQDFPKLLDSMQQGIERIHHISKSLRIFARSDTDYRQAFNLHEGLDSTLLILQHRLKANDSRPAIAVVKKYGDLPLVECFPGQLNQVFMNILANAIDALDEASLGRNGTPEEDPYNCITIQTELENKTGETGNGKTPSIPQVTIRITDNGVGMTDQVKQRAFDHLFTTKAVGKGTGLGLAIVRQIVVEKHGGAIAVNSTLGQGTEFVIKLPIKGANEVDPS